MPSKKQSEKSEEALGRPENDLVYDFLYYDQTRISSFLAQFDPSGHLTNVTNNERAHRSRKDNTSTQAVGSAAIIKGSFTETTDVSAEYGKQVTKSYDPRWANALAFLDYLEQQNLLRRNIGTARIGEIVLINGDLSLFDLGLLQKMWGLQTVKKQILSAARGESRESHFAENRQTRRKNSAGKQQPQSTTEAELVIEMLPVLPHAIQAAVSKDDVSAWSTLREDSITITAADLYMKHGLSISGEWAMVGVLDAFPDIEAAMDDGTPYEIAKQIVAGSKLSMAGFMLAPHLVAPIKGLLGRPSSSYGVTPLLLFRAISAPEK